MLINQSFPVMEKLRSATRDDHTRLQALPFFQALAGGKLPIESYIGQLRAMTILQGVLESQLTHTHHQALAFVWEDSMAKLSLLEQDLAYFEFRLIPDIPEAIENAQEMACRIRLRSTQAPLSLLGDLYVLEGSTLGGAVLRCQITDNFHLKGSVGVAYLSSYGDELMANWRRFSKRMNDTLIDDIEQERVIEAARAAFEGIEKVFRTLYPFIGKTLKYLVTSINPEAGTHPVPENLREFKAALRAGDIQWREFPYLEWRYGDRGRRFTRSDSAWLATLCQHDQLQMRQQIHWLGTVLSNRGIPQWLLQRHLEILYQELCKAIPENQSSYQKLLQVAQALGEIRRQHMDDELFWRLARIFDSEIGAVWARRLAGTGALLVAAVVDEKAGIENAVTSIAGWLTDPSRFPELWIRAVQGTLARARRQCR